MMPLKTQRNQNGKEHNNRRRDCAHARDAGAFEQASGVDEARLFQQKSQTAEKAFQQQAAEEGRRK